MKLFLQHTKNLARMLQEKNCKIIFFQDLIKILQQNYLAIFCSLLIARKASFLLQDLQDLVQNLARKVLVRFGYFLQDCFARFSCFV